MELIQARFSSMKSSQTISLSPTLWSKLPRDLLHSIIYQTTDQETLSTWIEATQGSPLIHLTAIKNYWRTTIVSDRDLIPAPGDDTETFDKILRTLEAKGPGQQHQAVGQTVHALLSRITRSDSCPANYVIELVFDLRMLSYWTKDIQSRAFNAWDLMPSDRTLEHTLSMLKGQFHSLRYVSCYGVPMQPILDFVVGEGAGIHELNVRSLDGYGRLRSRDDSANSEQRNRRTTIYWPLQWRLLPVFDHLRSLSIHHLQTIEVADLYCVMPRLTSLHSLTLACHAQGHRTAPYVCPLEALYHRNPRHDPHDGDHDDNQEERVIPERLVEFPPNLVSLSLMDTKPSDKFSVLPHARSLFLGNGLVSLSVDIEGVNLSSLIVDCLPNMTLRDLSLSMRRPGGSQWLRVSSADFNHSIAKHQDSLEKVRLLRAWDMEQLRLLMVNARWRKTFVVEELVLGTASPWFYRRPFKQNLQSDVKPSLLDYLCGFESTKSRSERWGRDLRRIRIDHVEISDLDASILSESSYSQLQILMLRPESRMSHGHYGEETTDRSVCIHLAEHILTHAAASLRVLVIDASWFWISRNSTADGVTLWTWADAQADSVQKQLMLSTLKKSDLDFLDCSKVPPWSERDPNAWSRSFCRVGPPWQPGQEMLHQWNYLTMLPVSKREGQH